MTVLAPRNGWRLPRALVASAALHALVLQALLGMRIVPPPAAPFDGLCLASGSAGSDGPARHDAARHDAARHDAALAACCPSVTCAGGHMAGPAQALPVAWPARRPSGLASPDARRPAGHAMVRAAARAPPVT